MYKNICIVLISNCFKISVRNARQKKSSVAEDNYFKNVSVHTKDRVHNDISISFT